MTQNTPTIYQRLEKLEGELQKLTNTVYALKVTDIQNYDKNFEFIPIEEEIYLNQEKYYSSIEQCHINSNANEFMKFMLKIINTSLDKIIKNNKFVMNDIQNRIIELIINDKYITQSIIAENLNVNIRTVKRNFKVLIENDIIVRVGSDKTGYWEVL